MRSCSDSQLRENVFPVWAFKKKKKRKCCQTFLKAMMVVMQGPDISAREAKVATYSEGGHS